MYDKIQACLDTALKNITGLPYIQFENTVYQPTTDTPWLRTKFMPTDRRPSVMGQHPVTQKPLLQRYFGIYQILINTPENKGLKATNDVFNLLIGGLEATKDLGPQGGVYVTIRQIEKMRAYQDSPWYKTPVNVHWYSYTN